MIYSRRMTISAVALLAVTPGVVRADESPFDAASNVVKWFVDLNKSFDEIVILEEKRQFLRRLNRLSKALFELEADSIQLRDQLPVAPPGPDRVADIREQVAAIRDSLAKTMTQAREIGHQMRVRGGETSIDAVRRFGYVRGAALDFLDEALLSLRSKQWDRAAVVERLDFGLNAVRRAQDEVNRFAARVAAQR